MFLRMPQVSTMLRGQESPSLQAPDPAPFDILCGKDKTYNKHQGNQIFREMIVSFHDVYLQAVSKQDKMKITKDIVRTLHAEYGARFVKLHKGQWQEISDQMARDKVSHALRFAAKGTTKPTKPQASRGSRLLKNSSTALTSSLTDASVNSSHSSVSTSSSSSVSSQEETYQEESSSPCCQEDEDTMVDSLFERQRLILKSLRFDEHLEEEIGVTNKRMSIIEKAIFLQKKNDAILTPVLDTVSRTNPLDFDTLRSEDFEALLNDPMDFHNSQEWLFDLTQ